MGRIWSGFTNLVLPFSPKWTFMAILPELIPESARALENSSRIVSPSNLSE
jgi:hypothetical protein